MDQETSKPKYICDPWDGTQGNEFVRRFAPDFEGALHTIQDKYATLYDHLHQLDPGSTGVAHRGTPPARGAPADSIYIESERAYTLRSRKLFGLIRQHVLDPDIRHEIDTTGNHSGRTAWQIVEKYGTPPRTGLTDIDADADWASIRLSDVGIDERTIIKIKAKLDRLNLEREASRRYNENERRMKLLSLITFPPDLASKARDELQRLSYKVGGNPSFKLTVESFDELWRHEYRVGNIKYQPPQQRSRRGHRVDAMHVDEESGSESDGAAPMDELHDDTAYVLNCASKPFPSSLRGEKLCDNCLGWGHLKEKCPSDVKPRRWGDCINGVRDIKLRKKNTNGIGTSTNSGGHAHDARRTKKGHFAKRYRNNSRTSHKCSSRSSNSTSLNRSSNRTSRNRIRSISSHTSLKHCSSDRCTSSLSCRSL